MSGHYTRTYTQIINVSLKLRIFCYFFVIFLLLNLYFHSLFYVFMLGSRMLMRCHSKEILYYVFGSHSFNSNAIRFSLNQKIKLQLQLIDKWIFCQIKCIYVALIDHWQSELENHVMHFSIALQYNRESHDTFFKVICSVFQYHISNSIRSQNLCVCVLLQFLDAF